MNFASYLASMPMLHSWDHGLTWNTGGFQPEHLQKLFAFMTEKLPPAPCILETGAGNSTICFLFLSPRKLVSIAPDSELFSRIRSYCGQASIPTTALEIHVDRSEWILPRMATEAKNRNDAGFDFVLIDGCHNWPLVFLDFFYGNFLLKTNGYIIIDDVNLHSVKELARMLMEQPDFELALDLGKSLVFRRVSDARSLGEWPTLPYIVRKSDEYGRSASPFAL